MSQHSGDAGPASYCGLCGDQQEGSLRTGDWHRKETFDGGTAPPSDVQWAPRTTGTEDAHETCRARLQLEPPRYCGQCGRRLKVQVTPLSWRASCSRHGVATS